METTDESVNRRFDVRLRNRKNDNEHVCREIRYSTTVWFYKNTDSMNDRKVWDATPKTSK